jgi:hypothetical protein
MDSRSNPVRVEMLDSFNRLVIIHDLVDGDYAWQIEMIDEYGEAVGVYTNDEWYPSPVLAYADGYIHFLMES